MYLITYDTTLYYFTFHISKIDLRICITFFIQNDFSNKLTINMNDSCVCRFLSGTLL